MYDFVLSLSQIRTSFYVIDLIKIDYYFEGQLFMCFGIIHGKSIVLIFNFIFSQWKEWIE